jgi:signal peptidase I
MTVRALSRTLWVLLVPVLAVLAAPFVWQVVTGDTFMSVTGTSMEPTYHVGDVLVVQDPAGHELEVVGQPVVVEFTPGDPTTQYVHRVLETTDAGAVLKGDGNDVADPSPITAEHVVGTPRTVLAGDLGTLYRVTQSWGTRGVVALLVIGLALLPTRPRRAPAPAADPTGRRAVREAERARS